MKENEIDYDELSLSDLEQLKKDRLIKQLKASETQNDDDVVVDTPSIATPIAGNGTNNFTSALDGIYTDYVQKDRNIFMHENGVDISKLENTDLDGYFEFASTDSGCDESSQLQNNWQSSQFASDILQSAIVTQELFNITRKVYKWEAGKGDGVQIRQISVAPDVNAVSACTCLSCASNTFDKYTITLLQIGQYHVECSWDAFKIGGEYRRSVVESMRRRWSEYFGSTIYSVLDAASWATTETLNATFDTTGLISGSCCSLSTNLMASLLIAQASLLEAGYGNLVAVISPSVMNYLLFKEAPSNPLWFEKMISVEGGYITRIGAMDVVVTGHARAASTATATNFAFVIDRTRALGAAFGKKPTFEFQRNASCNSWDIVSWSYVGFSALDLNAGVKIVSPNS